MSRTLEEQATNYETTKHIRIVAKLMHKIAKELIDRSDRHDNSKLEHPEVEIFTKYTNLLSDTTYGSPEYDRIKNEMGVALTHHYANNSHHPEHYKEGINDMNLLDIIEMFCDWKASSSRHNNGNLRKSIEINANRFGISPQLIKILENTVDFVS